ncbi:iron ABC transporter permease [Bacillus sp. V3-13]|uniref:ABC transporter permease n=1 Tax=Bacillus sp. V3-13 TaxID=2053728 RepID=UPI000C7636C5|nr:iron ABC transporter permease [Bacillus sp. V3-13]PLR77455.1 iron ABC transporter permease [Bacillus sp. V3-13]
MIPPYQSSLRKARPFHSFSFSSIFRSWSGILGFLLITCLFLLPVCRLVWLSLFSEGKLSLTLYQEVLTEAATWTTIKNTLWITTASTLVALVLGVSLAWIMAYVNLRRKKWLQLFIFMPFIIPSYITTLAWVQFFGQNGPLAALFSSAGPIFNLYSMEGIILVLGLSHYPLVYLLSIEVFRKIPRELQQAANAGGAANWTIFTKIVFPMALPGIAGGGLLAFLSNLDNFGIPAFLGIPANIRVLSTYIYEQVIGYGPSAFARAAVLSVLLGLIALIGTVLQWLIIRKSKVHETASRDMEPRYFLTNGWRSAVEFILWAFLLCTSLIPFLTMAATSFLKAYGLSFRWENLSLKNYQYLLFEDAKTINAVTNSITLALAAMLCCFVIGTAIAYLRFKHPSVFVRLTEIMVTIPYALPGTVFALSIILMWLQPIPGWQPGVYGTVWILLIAYIARFTILQMRGSLTAFSQIDPSMEEAALTAGAGRPAKWRKILLPLLLPGVLGGALLVFLTALTELTVSSLLWSSGSETIGVVIFSFEQAGYSTLSTAFSSMIVLVIMLLGILYIFAEKVWKERVIKNDDTN